MTPRLTVFTSTVYADLARLWHACAARAFPGAVLEIFDDSPGQAIDPALFPGATILRRAPDRRDFHEAYNDAVRRCGTATLAFVDTDVFVVSRAVASRAETDLARPEVGAVSFVSRTVSESHGTFAVFLKPDVYRRALEALPDGFFPRIDGLDPSRPGEPGRTHDTGDLLTRAVVAGRHEVRLLNLPRGAGIVRFDAITLTRLAAGWMGRDPLEARSREDDYFWHGLAGNAFLARLHDRLFPAGPAYGLRVPVARAARLALSGALRSSKGRLAYLLRLRHGASRVRRFLREDRSAS